MKSLLWETHLPGLGAQRAGEDRECIKIKLMINTKLNELYFRYLRATQQAEKKVSLTHNWCLIWYGKHVRKLLNAPLCSSAFWVWHLVLGNLFKVVYERLRVMKQSEISLVVLWVLQVLIRFVPTNHIFLVLPLYEYIAWKKDLFDKKNNKTDDEAAVYLVAEPADRYPGDDDGSVCHIRAERRSISHLRS